MEHSARVLVMAVQVLAGMWKRNGYSVFRQVITYQYSYPREMMYDKDIVMLQVSCGYYYTVPPSGNLTSARVSHACTTYASHAYLYA